MAATGPVGAKDPDRTGSVPENMDDADEGELVPLVVWATRLSVYFLAQGGILLLSYAYYGFHTDPRSFPLGFRLDPIQAALHFVWGLAGTYIGFFRPRYATAYVIAFAVFDTLLVVLGTLTNYRFGMMLEGPASVFYLALLLPAWAVVIHALLRPSQAS
jgi:hypothetical protein